MSTREWGQWIAILGLGSESEFGLCYKFVFPVMSVRIRASTKNLQYPDLRGIVDQEQRKREKRETKNFELEYTVVGRGGKKMEARESKGSSEEKHPSVRASIGVGVTKVDFFTGVGEYTEAQEPPVGQYWYT
eukprot:1395518-Amorphochlora_amoeboformis.AAC.1